MRRCPWDHDKMIFPTHEEALLKIVEIAFDPTREARGGTTPRSTYVCLDPHAPTHWHMTAYENESGWKVAS